MSLSVTRIEPGPLSANEAAAITAAANVTPHAPIVVLVQLVISSAPARAPLNRTCDVRYRDLDGLEAADDERRHTHGLLGEFEAGRALDQRPEARLQLDPRERSADADVDAAA